MAKLLTVSDWMLLALGGFLDFFYEMGDPFNLLSNYYSSFYGFVPTRFKKTNFYHTIWRNLKTGNIEKTIEKGQIILKLTTAGRRKIEKKFPLIMLQNKKWNKKWRLVVFDIEEKARKIRNVFRRKLKELNFGQLQKSVWISPLDFLEDFKDLIEENNLERNVILIETDNLTFDNEKELAERLWHLSKINELYIEIYEKLYILKTKGEKNLKQSDDRHNFLNELKQEIMTTYLKDPHLPKELLPEDWQGEKVRKLVKELRLFEKI